MDNLLQTLAQTKAASKKFAYTSIEKRNAVLLQIADGLEARFDEILQANALDVEQAKSALGGVMVDRLLLTKARIQGMANGVREVAALPDPLGRTLQEMQRPNGLQIQKISVPLGVVAIIYESRPNVTADGAALCLKSGNACVLRGGKEAYKTCQAIVRIMKDALAQAGLDEDLIVMPTDTSRESANTLMTAVGLVDVLIPRGGAGLIRACVENAKVPCIQTGTGICHLYVDEEFDLSIALSIIENAKTSRPSVCNALEVCLIHKNALNATLPPLKALLCEKRAQAGLPPVELRLCEKSQKIIGGTAANDDDFDTEFLDYILAIKAVDSVEDAIEHIAQHSTGHSDGIITTNPDTAKKFIAAVDSAAVYVNASTRFTDGGEFGKGCEIGISTQKMHARGPMGLEELTSYKYVVYGEGQIR